jgi:hypothetical protein
MSQKRHFVLWGSQGEGIRGLPRSAGPEDKVIAFLIRNRYDVKREPPA